MRRGLAELQADLGDKPWCQGDRYTLADIAVGMHLRAEGTDNADGSLDASSVMAGTGGHDSFGRGGRGHGWDDGTAPAASPNSSATPG